MAEWYRRYHGTCRDPKLEKVARRAGVPRPYAIAAWDAILEYASAQNPRGSIVGLDAEEIEIAIGCTPEQAMKLLETFHETGMCFNETIAAWDKRQYASDISTERVRAFREKRRQAVENKEKQKETARVGKRNVSETHQNRTEQNRESIYPAPNGAGVCDGKIRPREAELKRAFHEQFWPDYPNKKGKDAAETKFVSKAKQCGVDEIIAGLGRAVAEWERKGTETKFIPHPATWLNQGRWKDEPDTSRPADDPYRFVEGAL